MRRLSRRALQATPLQLGRPVRCDDGTAGRLEDVVVEPEERRLTHLVVEEPEGQARLVPAERLRPERQRNLAVPLRGTTADVRACASIRSFLYAGADGFPRDDESGDVGIEDVLVVPSFGAAEFAGYATEAGESFGVTYDRIPRGSAELRRGSPVLSSEGEEMGRLDGVLVDGDRLTHVVLQGSDRHRDRPIAVPVEAVARIETDRVTLDSARLPG